MTTPDTAVPRLVVVDDTDPSIQYSPASVFMTDTSGKLDGQGYGGPVFNRTLTGLSGSSNLNGSLTFQFNGTFVRAVLAAQGDFGWACRVDNHLITSNILNSNQVTNYIACDSEGSLSGSTSEHTLEVDLFLGVDPPFVLNSSLWLDNIQYQPLPSDPLDALTLRIHNSDPSVSYSNSSGEWTAFQSLDANATDLTGSSMSLAFNGTSVTLYSIDYGSPAQYEAATAFYTLDGKSADFDIPGSMKTANSEGNTINISNWPLFTISNLSASQHDLNVASSYNTSSFPQQYLSIEYFIIRTNPANSSSTEGSANSTGVGSSSGNSSSTTGHSTGIGAWPVGGIVGGVMGGVIGLVAILLALYFIRRRRRNSPSRFEGILDLGAGAALVDHLTNSEPPMQSPLTDDRPLCSGLSADSSYQSGKLDLGENTVAGSSPRTSLEAASNSTSRLVSMKNAQSFQIRNEQLRRSELRLHMDSGVRLLPPNEREVIDVPPTYTED
ncbi:hypothetical protein F5878DRAFT_256723 [Lentinula raphanica]|uniref:Acid protease n=1 Tax=Lentinula raphanica TaxID=153919 RepID=A0AA38PIJ2_9AGAR|nr:hypothetical protein F5878DRAFT_256723 [Lentinula raphanica]